MAKVTIAEIYVAIQEVNRRLDKINGKIEQHEARLHDHDLCLSRLSDETKHHSVNWDRVINVVVAVMQFIIIALITKQLQ